MSQESALRPLALQPLPLGSIKPLGWLRRQLEIQASGLSGYLDEFWPDVGESGWIGGEAEGWERGPYWLDGIVPLAYLLQDDRLIAKVQRWVDYILAHQQEDGWLGPVQSFTVLRTYVPYDPWPSFVALKALTQYQEATGDERVIPAMQRFFHKLAQHLTEQPLHSWACFRWGDLLLSIYWLYERTGEPWLLDLAALVHEQGYDWRGHFERFPWKERTAPEDISLSTHVVNSAMAVKTPGVWSRLSGDPAAREAIWTILDRLDRYHGQATGLFTGDEHYAGLNPSQGTELCAVVEYMYSLEVLLAILGAPALGDRLERIAYNALPATFSPDMWAHQYDQQANQVLCAIAEDRIYTNNAPDSNIFGLEPNFGCCTANLHQGWPKLTSHLWMKTPDGGLAAVAHAPSRVTTTLGGVPVTVECESGYPFRDTLRFTVRAERPARFPLDLRVPAWAEEAEVRVAGGKAMAAPAGGFYRLDRTWQGTTKIMLRLPMQPRTERRYHQSVAIHRGPLVYALQIGEEWKLVRGEPPAADWEVRPTTPWNYALLLDPEHPERSITFEERPLGDYPFSPEGAPVIAHVQGRRVPEWVLEHNAAGPLPESPVRSDEPLETLTLLPYGSTHLRVTEFPLLEEEKHLATN